MYTLVIVLTASGDLVTSPLAAFAASIAETVPAQIHLSEFMLRLYMSLVPRNAQLRCVPAASVIAFASLFAGKALPPAKGLTIAG